MDDVVIVGGGIIGASTAYFLSNVGRKVKARFAALKRTQANKRH